VHILTCIAVKAALHCADETHWVILLEFASYLAGASRHYTASCFMTNRDRVLTEDQTLVVGLEEHDVGVAEGRA
jgi:hypothetical protein